MSVISKASLVLIPSGYGEDKLYSEVPNTAAGDFTFTRASTGTRVNADGYIEEVPCNLITYSEDYSSGSWVKSNTTTIANDTISPRGLQDATKIHPNSSGNYRHIRNNLFNPLSGLFTFSIYAKAGELDHLVLIDYDGGGIGIDFDLTNGVATDNASTPFDSFSMTDYGNGWYRCEATATDMYFYWILSDNGGLSVTANGTDGLYIWGAMINKGTSVKTYIKTTDRLDIPRLDYSGGASCPTLLLETQRTNTIVQSEDLSIVTILNNATVTTDQTTSPDNTNTADKVTFGSGSGFFYKQISITVASTFSIFLKYDDYQYFQLMGTGDVDHYANFDIQNGVLGNVGSQATAKIEDYGNGWYRCSLSMYAGTFAGAQRVLKTTSLTTNWNGGGGGAGSVFAWGMQLESGIYETSYIPTSGTSVTRVGDVCNDGGDATIFNDSEGVLFVEIAALADDLTSRVISLNDGSTSNRVIILYQTITSAIRVIVSSGGSIEFDSNTQNYDITNFNKIALKYNENDFALWINGTEISTDTSGLTPIGLNNLEFNNANGTSNFFGKCKQLIYFNEALTDTELETLTTI